MGGIVCAISYMDHFTVTFKPDGKQISIHSGALLLEAAGQAGIVLNTICGGKGTCGKCAVDIEPSGQRILACQNRIRSDVTVTVPLESRFFEHKILSHGLSAKTDIRPTLYKTYRLKYHTRKIFGLAIDVGTTTVVAKLVDMTTGDCIATEATLNPQTRFGDDVVSRITYARTESGSADLHRVIIECINDLIDKLCRATGVELKHIYEMCVVGNTTMNHLFLKFPVVQLGYAPYRAFSVDSHDISPEELNLRMNAVGNVHTVENIAGFVGADTTAGVLAVDIDSAEDVTLFVDIGTNGELVLNTKGQLYAASCAAGPAFEGARITCGSRAVEGAIEAVVLTENDIDIDVIGNNPPHSICGSGLIDAVAVLLDLGVVDATGRFSTPQQLEKTLPSAILSRIFEKDRQMAFCLAYDQNNQPAVFLTQKDIREVQLAKAAIRAGIKILLQRNGLEDSDIKHILLAGAFGNYIRRESALRIGLLPDIPVEGIRFFGNTAVAGAQIILLSRQCRNKAKRLAHKIKYIEIAHEKDFQAIFADSMLF